MSLSYLYFAALAAAPRTNCPNEPLTPCSHKFRINFRPIPAKSRNAILAVPFRFFNPTILSNNQSISSSLSNFVLLQGLRSTQAKGIKTKRKNNPEKNIRDERLKLVRRSAGHSTKSFSFLMHFLPLLPLPFLLIFFPLLLYLRDIPS